jgi:sugar (pentulose or hexulose) kinase
MAGALLGVDAGTTTIEAVAYDPDGFALAHGEGVVDVDHPREGWAEVDMEAVWETTAGTIRSVVEDCPEPIDAVCVAGQGDGCWLVDREGEPVRPAVLWSDSRASGVLDRWREDRTLDEITGICGSEPFPGTALPILTWLAAHEPESTERAETLLACAGWLASRLSGRRTVDYSDASLPFLDPETLEYAPEVFEVADVGSPGLLPDLVPAGEVLGEVTDGAAETTGLSRGTPVVAGPIDVWATALGCGAVAPNDAVSIVGTSAVHAAVRERPGGEGIGMALAPGIYLDALGSNVGTASVEWAMEVLGVESYDALSALAHEAPPGSSGVLYQPYLSSTGERAPFVDPHARAGFLGIGPDHGREHLARAVYEGVALALRDCREALSATGPLRLGGGAARSPFWSSVIADCLGDPVLVPAGDAHGARGAAMLAGVGTGAFAGLPEAADRMVRIERREVPGEATARYDDLFAAYREARDGMNPTWRSLATLREAFPGPE